MATLTINGNQVKVDDSFLKLSPQDQEKTVDEIAAKLGAKPQPEAPGFAPGRGTEASSNVVTADGTPIKPPDYQNPMDRLGTLGNELAGAVPIVGPSLRTAGENVDAWVDNNVYRPLTGATGATTTPEDVAKVNAEKVRQNPTQATAGAVAGTVLPFMVGGEIAPVAKVLGMDASVPLLARTGASAASTAAISGLDSMARGGSPQDAAKDAGLGAILGAALPGVGTIIGKGLDAAGGRAKAVFDALTNPDHAAQKMVAGTAVRDLRQGAGMTAADEASAAANGQPIINADRFGNNVRTLARTAGNADATAEQSLKDMTEQRFLTQGDRATNFVKRISGGSVDDLAAQSNLEASARAANRAAYDRAYTAPRASAVWTPEIQQLMQSPDVLAAIRGAERTAANDAALTGTKAVRNPFTFDAQGVPKLRQNPDGSTALPNLQFWDVVQRNLRRMSDKARRAPDGKSDARDLDLLRRKLLDGLDGAVPEFKVARAGAAAAFGAEDALDAGRRFVTQNAAIPEAKAAYEKFSPAERKLFATGFSSSLIDKIGAARDRVNVINQVFGSPAARQQVELALGKPAAAQLEQFTRVEDIMQMTKQNVVARSDTAKNLIAQGVVGGLGGGLLGGWDPRNVGMGMVLLPAGRAGLRALGKTVDQRVMQRVAEILSSGDPAQIDRVIMNSVMSEDYRTAVRAIETGLDAVARGEATAVGRPNVETAPIGALAP